MTKTEAIALFGDVKRDAIQRMADTLEITRTAIYMWPEELPLHQADRVMGAAWRKGLIGRRRRTWGWWEDYKCGCISTTVNKMRELPGYCPQHGEDSRYVHRERARLDATQGGE